MILGIGVDLTQNTRFESWQKQNYDNLCRIFSKYELSSINEYTDQQKIEFFASRFAAKEAFFKALSASFVKLEFHKQTSKTFDLLFVCKNTYITSDEFGIPQISINKEAFEHRIGLSIPKFQIDLTLSHESDYSVAVVIISS